MSTKSIIHYECFCTYRDYAQPNVKGWSSTTPYYNGREQTYYVSKDSRNVNFRSPAADYANQQKFMNKNGYIGTKDQYTELVNNYEYLTICYNIFSLTYDLKDWCLTTSVIGSSATWIFKNNVFGNHNPFKTNQYRILSIF